MSANRFGHIFQVTTFGESHGAGLGVVIEGCPAGVAFDELLLKKDLDRRRPGKELWVSQRNELDQPEILSGVFAGKTLGTPIAILVRNQDARSEDYEQIKTAARAGHADDVWQNKFGHRDHRGGGRSSGRETLCRVMAGSVAKMVIKALSPETRFAVLASRIGDFEITETEKKSFLSGDLDSDQYVARFPSSRDQQVKELLIRARESGESYGGTAEIHVLQPPKNLGQPVFHKLKSDLAQAMMSVGATAGVSIGETSDAPGTQFHSQGEAPYGGIRGGISTGQTIQLSVQIKPTSSILDVAKKGRHDPCIVPRALVVFEAMTALVLCDHLLWSRLDRI